MQPAKRYGLVALVVVGTGAAGWYLTEGNDGTAADGPEEAVVAQPSGEVIVDSADPDGATGSPAVPELETTMAGPSTGGPTGNDTTGDGTTDGSETAAGTQTMRASLQSDAEDAAAGPGATAGPSVTTTAPPSAGTDADDPSDDAQSVDRSTTSAPEPEATGAVAPASGAEGAAADGSGQTAQTSASGGTDARAVEKPDADRAVDAASGDTEPEEQGTRPASAETAPAAGGGTVGSTGDDRGAQTANAAEAAAGDEPDPADKRPETAGGDSETVLAAVDPVQAPPAQGQDGAESDPSDPALATTEDPAADQPAGETVDPRAPRLDVVRVDAQGQTVLAGQAEPGSRVEIMLDDAVIGEVDADASGAFVAILDLDLSERALSLQLRTRAPDLAADSEIADVPAPSVLSAPELPGNGVAAASPDDAPTAAVQPQAGLAPAPDPDSAAVTAPALPEPRTPLLAPTARAPELAAASVPDTASGLDTAPGAPAERTPGPGAAQQAGTTPVTPAPDAPDEVEQGRYRVSAPVIILPSAGDTEAPALVQPREAGLAVLQPSVERPKGVFLERISYSDFGDVQLSGRARPGLSVRIYGNGLIIGTTRVTQDGTWSMALPQDRGKAVKLFRFDEIRPGGGVSSRIETPFEYARLSPKVVRDRQIVIQRGDMLWRIAEQYYGQGLRYSLIYGANSGLIRDPDLIYPGQVLSIPELVDAQ